MAINESTSVKQIVKKDLKEIFPAEFSNRRLISKYIDYVLNPFFQKSYESYINGYIGKKSVALEEGDFDTFKKLIKESGDSSFKYLQNVYSSHDLTNQSVSIGLAISDISLGDKGVSRVHGGGFAGTIQAFVPNDIVSMYKKNMEHVFGEGACHVLKVRPYGGMKVL